MEPRLVFNSITTMEGNLEWREKRDIFRILPTIPRILEICSDLKKGWWGSKSREP